MNIFDEEYFERVHSGIHKSNYTRVGGYAHWASEQDWSAIADRLGVKAGDYVLDVGCAYGYLVAELRRRGVEAFGLDISEYALRRSDIAVAHYLMKGDILDEIPGIPDRHPSKKWDLVVSLDLLEHFDLVEAMMLMEAISARARRQFHQVNTGEREGQAFGGDVTHKEPHSLDEWRAIAPEDCEIERT